MTMKRWHTLLVSLAATTMLFVPGCSDNSKSSPPEVATPRQPSRSTMHIKVVGKCTNSGGLQLQSSGFTPGGSYQTEAWYPSGEQYPHLAGTGTAGTNGDTPNWRWDCFDGANGKRDPEGTYSLRLTDLATGRKVNSKFKVQY